MDAFQLTLCLQFDFGDTLCVAKFARSNQLKWLLVHVSHIHSIFCRFRFGDPKWKKLKS